MSPKALEHGDRLTAIFGRDENRLYDIERVGLGDCGQIVVVMEYGQMSGVPWAAVMCEGVELRRYNLALCPGVET